MDIETAKPWAKAHLGSWVPFDAIPGGPLGVFGEPWVSLGGLKASLGGACMSLWARGPMEPVGLQYFRPAEPSQCSGKLDRDREIQTLALGGGEGIAPLDPETYIYILKTS